MWKVVARKRPCQLPNVGEELLDELRWFEMPGRSGMKGPVLTVTPRGGKRPTRMLGMTRRTCRQDSGNSEELLCPEPSSKSERLGRNQCTSAAASGSKPSDKAKTQQSDSCALLLFRLQRLHLDRLVAPADKSPASRTHKGAHGQPQGPHEFNTSVSGQMGWTARSLGL